MGRYLDEEDGYDFEMGRMQARSRVGFILILAVCGPLIGFFGLAFVLMAVLRLLD